MCKCLPDNTKQNNNSECISIDDNDNNKDFFILLIFIIMTGIFLLIIIICFCKSICKSPKKYDELLINQINTELISQKELSN